MLVTRLLPQQLFYRLLNKLRKYRLYKLDNQWVPTETNWNQREIGIPWEGGDYDDSQYEDGIIFSSLGWQNWCITGLVRSWLQNPALNHGFIIAVSSTGPGNKEFKFRSSAYMEDSTRRQKLTLFYLDERCP